MNAFANLAALADEPYRRTDDRPLIAVFPMWFPYEILLAGGLRASEWWGFPLATTLADAHFPPFVCTLVKANFEVLLGGAAAPDGMVFPSATCDSIQNSAGLFRRLYPKKFSAYFRMSQNPESDAAPAFLRYEIERLLHQVEAFVGRPITAGDLQHAIVATNRLRRAVRRLLNKLAAGRISVPARDVYTAIKGAVADVGETTAAWLEEFADAITVTTNGAKKLMLVGMTPEPSAALDLIENAGGRIVGDDLGLGWRTFAVDAAEDGDPVDALVNRLLNSPPCSSLHFDSKCRSDGVLARVRELGADAVVFTRVKFCDPEAFDYPNVKKALDEARVPNLLLERELVAGAEASTATRVEAFIEQLG